MARAINNNRWNNHRSDGRHECTLMRCWKSIRNDDTPPPFIFTVSKSSAEGTGSRNAHNAQPCQCNRIARLTLFDVLKTENGISVQLEQCIREWSIGANRRASIPYALHFNLLTHKRFMYASRLLGVWEDGGFRSYRWIDGIEWRRDGAISRIWKCLVCSVLFVLAGKSYGFSCVSVSERCECIWRNFCWSVCARQWSQLTRFHFDTRNSGKYQCWYAVASQQRINSIQIKIHDRLNWNDVRGTRVTSTNTAALLVCRLSSNHQQIDVVHQGMSHLTSNHKE